GDALPVREGAADFACAFEHEREREDRERHQDRRLRVHDSSQVSERSDRWRRAVERESRSPGIFPRSWGVAWKDALRATERNSNSASATARALLLQMSQAVVALRSAAVAPITGPANPTRAPRTAPPATTTQAAATEHRSTRSGNTPRPPSPATGPCQQGCGGTCCGTSS